MPPGLPLVPDMSPGLPPATGMSRAPGIPQKPPGMPLRKPPRNPADPLLDDAFPCFLGLS